MSEAMKVNAAIEFLAGRGVKISRRGFYNWLTVGVRGVTLQHDTTPNSIVTAKDRDVIVVTPHQLETFLASIGIG